MKGKASKVCITALVLLGAACPMGCLSQQPMPGGYSETSVTNAEVVAAAAFAVSAEEKALQKDAPSVRLTLVNVVSAQKQVVSGMNYRLRLNVKMKDADKEAEAVVWWQAWNVSEPYRLTSWKWK